MPPHKNIFDDRKDSSFVSEIPSDQHREQILVGMKAPYNKLQKKSINKEENIFTETKPQLNLHLNFKPDEQNLPL